MIPTHSDSFAVVRHINTNRLYKYHGNDEYTNLFTGVRGRIPPEQAQRMFKINLEFTEILNQYPLILELITKLKLVCDKPSEK